MKRNNIFTELLGTKDLFADIAAIVSMAENFFIDLFETTLLHGSEKRKKIAGECFDYYTSHYKNVPLWKNPELFKACIDYVTSKEKYLILANNLKCQLGITPAGSTPCGITRAYHYQKCFITDKNKIPLDSNNSFSVTHSSGSAAITFVHPIRGIFADFISDSIYPVHFIEKEAMKINDQITNATALLFEYSKEAYSEFFKLISYVFLTPDFGDTVRYSYNLRTQYFGSFFINPFQTTTVSFAESILHELIHQRLWMQWAYTLPDLTGYEKIMVISPFSNREKSLVVMTHAYIIYSVISDFRKFLINSNSLLKDEQAKIQADSKTESEKLSLLYIRLTENMPAHCALRKPLMSTHELFNDLKNGK